MKIDNNICFGKSFSHRSSQPSLPRHVGLADLLGSDFKHHYGPATASQSTPAKKDTPAVKSPVSPDDNDPRRNIFKMSFKKKPKPEEGASKANNSKQEEKEHHKVNSGGENKKKSHQPFARSNSMRILSDSE